MTLMLYRVIFVEIHALFPEILRFKFVTVIMNHPVPNFSDSNKLFYNVRA